MDNTQLTPQENTELAQVTDVNFQALIDAGVVLVNEIDRSGINVGTPVEVTYTSKKGNVKIYSLTLLG
jgi:hypothetical protein